MVIRGNVTAASYLDMLKDWFITMLEGSDTLNEFWFMQDGARPHTADIVLRYLNTMFDMGLEWSPYSPDMNPCDYFLWGYLKDRVYANNPQNFEELENNIWDEIDKIPPEMIIRVINEFPKRLECVLEQNGGHFEYLR